MNGYFVGLDPGSTIGYAVLDLDGNVISIDSFKGSFADTIRAVTKYGKVLAVGTDVKKVPKFVEKFASKVGAKVIAPNYDLLYYEKLKKTKEYMKKNKIKLSDRHQMDALASALVAYKHFMVLFNKIDN